MAAGVSRTRSALASPALWQARQLFWKRGMISALKSTGLARWMSLNELGSSLASSAKAAVAIDKAIKSRSMIVRLSIVTADGEHETVPRAHIDATGDRCNGGRFLHLFFTSS